MEAFAERLLYFFIYVNDHRIPVLVPLKYPHADIIDTDIGFGMLILSSGANIDNININTYAISTLANMHSVRFHVPRNGVPPGDMWK